MRALVVMLLFVGATYCVTPPAQSACCYFSAKNQDVLQPSQKVFITWDPEAKQESFTVQPKFTGNARDFGMVIPTPSRPKLDEMPRDFFKELAVFTILKRREHPQSRLVFRGGFGFGGGGFGGGGFGGFGGGGFGVMPAAPPRKPAVQVLETGVVGSLDYKVLAAERADDLYTWLKNHRYHYAGDEATLDFYVRKNWFFTVMKIDAMQMKPKADGTYTGEVTPTRFQFTSDRLIYPLRITQLSVKEKTEALFYVQAPYKVDLPGDNSYQHQWVGLLQNAQGWYGKGSKSLPGGGDEWLQAVKPHADSLRKQGAQLGFSFVSGQRPTPNWDGRIATTLEWAKRLSSSDIGVLRGHVPYSEQVPNVDQGFTARDVATRRQAEAVYKVIQDRLAQSRQLRPDGYLVREAADKDVKDLRILAGHLKEGQFLTKFRKTFTRAEMEDDLLIEPAKVGEAEDVSEYEEILPSSPP